MSGKRAHIEVDPDYEDVSEQQNKRRKVMEEDAKAATKRKIESIIKKHFDIEIESKESELLEVSEKLELAKSIMDRLRACIVANFFGNANQQKTNSRKSLEQTPMIHPTVRKFIGKAPPGTPYADSKPEPIVTSCTTQVLEPEKIGNIPTQRLESVKQSASSTGNDEKETGGSRQGRFKVKKRLIVGNVSKSIPADQRDDNDQATHKWMVYVRGAKDCPNITGFVKKVWFFLHPSYRPNDLVEVSQPPFHLTRRGWGEFPVRVQIHFLDSRNKRVDIIHNLKLDRTYTGLQTLGAETVVDIEIERDMADVKLEKKQRGDADSRNVSKSIGLQHTTTIKQEPMESGYKSQAIPCQTFPLLQDIKMEPVDHEYGRTTSAVSNGCVKKELESQVGVAQKSVGSSGCGRNLLTCIQTIGSPSVITTQAISILTSISQSHNHLVLNSSSPPKQKIVSNNGHLMLTSPPGNIVFKAVGQPSSPAISTVNLKLMETGAVKTGTGSNVTTSFTLTQPATQTGVVNKTQNPTQNRIPVNQSGNSGLIFLKCTDNQGKTFLIPQQIGNTLTSPTKGVNSVIGAKAGVNNNRPLLLTGGLPVSNVANLGVTGNVNTIQGKQLVQQLVRSPNMVSPTTRPQKAPLQNGPVFFIKPDNINRTPLTVKTSNISTSNTTPVKVNSNLQIVRNSSQKQNAEIVCVKPVNQSLISPDNHSVNKGQLKVTPQGLIHVQGQNISPNIGISTAADKSPQGSIRQKQPIVLIPSNGKVTLLPNKGKSLLNSVTNIQNTPTSGNNIILFNQSVSPIGNGNVVCGTPSPVANQKQPVSKINNSDMFVLQTKKSKSGVNAPNHVVIIPVSSEQNSSIVSTSSLNTLTSVTMTSTNKVSNSHLNMSNCIDKKVNDKTMFIVVQNEKNAGGGMNNSLIDSSILTSKSSTSLLTPSPSLSAHNTPKLSGVSHHLTQVTVSSSDAKPKQILLVNQEEDKLDTTTPGTGYSMEDRKCIMDPKKKKQKMVPLREFIQPLCIKDFPDILSLLRATVSRHPLVSENTGRNLHPYCARTNEDWLTWNVGKRRAAEWQRASCVRKFIIQALGGSIEYKGKSLWTTKQILVWCRLHAYSPHYLERPLHPTGIDLQAETSIISDKLHKKYSSLTNVQHIHEELLKSEHLTEHSETVEEDVDILSDTPVQRKVKVEDQSTDLSVVEDPEYLPLTDGAMYVEEMAQQIGVRLQQTEVEPGYFGTLTHGMLYKSMENFMSEILRETFALQVNMGRYPDTLSVTDVYKALNNLNKTDFLTNKYLGVEDNMGIPTAPT